MIVLFGVLGIAVVAVVAVLLSRPRALIHPDPVPGRPTVAAPAQLTAADLAAVRFPIAVRGYRMADVDAYLAAASAALAAASAASDLSADQPPQPVPVVLAEPAAKESRQVADGDADARASDAGDTAAMAE